MSAATKRAGAPVTSAEVPTGPGRPSTWCSAGALGNLTIGLLIMSMVPLMYGLVDPASVIATLPWQLPAFPVILIVVILQFREGEIVGATANGVLGGVLMGQNVVRGLQTLGSVYTGHQVPDSVVAGGHVIDGFVYLVGGIILLAVAWLTFFGLSAVGGVGISAGALGFLCVSAASFGMGQVFGLVGSVGLTLIAVWLLYSGLAMLLSGATGRPSLPLGRPLGRP